MIQHSGFKVEPWSLHETTLELDHLAQTESLFALANGHIGMRGNLDEGEPYGIPGTYLAGFYELRKLPYAEAGYGYPEAGETIVNVTNGKLLRLLVEDEPFDIRYGTLIAHERVLDLRAGVLTRTVEWSSPTGRVVRVKSTRLVSLSLRSIAAIHYEVEPVKGTLPIVVQSELVANEPLPTSQDDPREASGPESVLVTQRVAAEGSRALLVHATRASGLTVAAAMEHVVDATQRVDVGSESHDDLARVTFAADVAPGSPLRLVKYVAYGWSGGRSAGRPAGSGRGGSGQRPQGRLGEAAVRTADLPRPLLGGGRHRDRRGRGTAAGSTIRALPHPPDGCPRRATTDRRQGVDGPRLQRPRLLGHRDIRAAGADVHRPADRPRRARLAPQHAGGRT